MPVRVDQRLTRLLKPAIPNLNFVFEINGAFIDLYGNIVRRKPLNREAHKERKEKTKFKTVFLLFLSVLPCTARKGRCGALCGSQRF